MGCIGNYCNNYTTPCKNNAAGVQCAAWSSAAYGDNTYSCSGHTRKRTGESGQDPDNTPQYADYYVGTTIDDVDINTLRLRIIQEIVARRQHKWYGSLNTIYSGSDVAEGEIIHHVQQNDLAQCIGTINALVNTYASKGDNQLGDGTNPANPKQTNLHQVTTGNYVEAKNLKELERVFTATARDCICYSDCVGYNAGGRKVCSCYGYCCHYN